MRQLNEAGDCILSYPISQSTCYTLNFKKLSSDKQVLFVCAYIYMSTYLDVNVVVNSYSINNKKV